MERLPLAISLVALSAASASAADLAARPYVEPPRAPAIYDWSGFYVGANGGYGWTTESRYLLGSIAPYASFNPSGGAAGGQFGWRTQAGAFVWGFDLQADWTNLKGVATPGNVAQPTTTVNDLASLAVTAGWAVNNVLFYGKAGAMMANNKFSDVHANNPANTTYSNEQRWGGMLGAGLEYGFTPNWSFAVEYEHGFLGAVNDSFLQVGTGLPSGNNPIKRVYQDIDLVTGRINYRFGGPVVARY
jgi:outer membrane immunogenic protein